MNFSEHVMWLVILAAVAFVQNAMFTLTSRSRSSADPTHHRRCAWGSNGVWLVCHLLVWKNIWNAFETGEWGWLIAMAVVYTIATAEGSVWMMRVALRREKGDRRVGAKKRYAKEPEECRDFEGPAENKTCTPRRHVIIKGDK